VQIHFNTLTARPGAVCKTLS